MSRLSVAGCLCWMFVAFAGPSLADTTFNDGFDELAEDVPVTSRTIGGITVTITPTTGEFRTRTYNVAGGIVAFDGANTSAPFNDPISIGNVSSPRFISTRPGAAGADLWDTTQPFTFDFSQPIKSFGLTTIDVMENTVTGDDVDPTDEVTLEAWSGPGGTGTMLDSHTFTGPQGASGLDLDFFVSATGNMIQSATLFNSAGDGLGTTGGFGIDDLVLVQAVPEPGSFAIFVAVFGVALGSFWLRQKRRNR